MPLPLILWLDSFVVFLLFDNAAHLPLPLIWQCNLFATSSHLKTWLIWVHPFIPCFLLLKVTHLQNFLSFDTSFCLTQLICHFLSFTLSLVWWSCLPLPLVCHFLSFDVTRLLLPLVWQFYLFDAALLPVPCIWHFLSFSNATDLPLLLVQSFFSFDMNHLLLHLRRQCKYFATTSHSTLWLIYHYLLFNQ